MKKCIIHVIPQQDETVVRASTKQLTSHCVHVYNHLKNQWQRMQQTDLYRNNKDITIVHSLLYVTSLYITTKG